MTTELTDLYTALFDSFEALDQKLDGYGLYAIRDYQKTDERLHPPFTQEWNLAICPVLKTIGSSPWGKPSTGNFHVTLPDQRRVGIKMFNISTVKVRNYGSQHRIDPYRDYSERWDTIEWDKWLWSLWKAHWGYFRYNRFDVRSICLIGFSDRPDPFAKELVALQQAVDWEKHGAIYQSRTWADRYDRAIWVRLSAWHFGAEKAVVS